MDGQLRETAPFHAAVAGGPPARAAWLRARDGARLRVAVWPRDGARGSVVMLPGRTEYVEKYARPAAALADMGFASAAIDWRGQGLSDRPRRDPRVGHVGDFADFQADLDALMAHLTAVGLPRPWHLLAHSMGGLIGLRALERDLGFARAVFSAPMWGLPLPPQTRLFGWGLSAASALLGLGERAVPRSGKLADPAAAPFEGNLLTTDPETFAWMQAQLAAHPELALGGPSLGWLWAALREMHRLARIAAPDVACLTVLGTGEAIVDPDAIHVRMASWPGGRLHVVQGARHEVLMERPELRDPVMAEIGAHLAMG